MSTEEQRGEDRLAREILRYFLRNPHSADSLEGVATWRLLDEKVHRAVEETQQALDWLVANGYLVAVSWVGADRVFRLNHERRDEAARFAGRAEPSSK